VCLFGLALGCEQQQQQQRQQQQQLVRQRSYVIPAISAAVLAAPKAHKFYVLQKALVL
jgi:uncharacterized protein YcfL